MKAESKTKKATVSKKSSTKVSATRAKAKSKAKTAEEKLLESLPEDTVTIDRRRKEEPVKVERRQKVTRRRQIDPTTCERNYSDDEIEFMAALDEYKRSSGRMFPTCSEVLEVLKNLGYQKVLESQEIEGEEKKEGEEGEEAVRTEAETDLLAPSFVSETAELLTV